MLVGLIRWSWCRAGSVGIGSTGAGGAGSVGTGDGYGGGNCRRGGSGSAIRSAT